MGILEAADKAAMFHEAGELIRQDGFTKHDRSWSGIHIVGYTVDMALCAVSHGLDDPHDARCLEMYDAFCGLLLMAGQVRLQSRWTQCASDLITTWNDDRHRTSGDVLGALGLANELCRDIAAATS